MGLKIDELPAAILADLDAVATEFEIQDMNEALPADQSKKLTLGIIRNWLAASAFAALTITGALTFGTKVISTTALATPAAVVATTGEFFASTVSGATLMGFGTTGDVTLKNRAGTDVLVVTSNTLNVALAGALNVVGDFSVATNKLTVAAASGNTVAAGTLKSTLDFTVGANKLVVTAASGNLVTAGTLATAAPATGASGAWLLGKYKNDGVALVPSATDYIQVEIDGGGLVKIGVVA